MRETGVELVICIRLLAAWSFQGLALIGAPILVVRPALGAAILTASGASAALAWRFGRAEACLEDPAEPGARVWEPVEWTLAPRAGGRTIGGRDARLSVGERWLRIDPRRFGLERAVASGPQADSAVRVPRLDVVEVAAEGEVVRIRFLDETGRAQDLMVRKVAAAEEFARAVAGEAGSVRGAGP